GARASTAATPTAATPPRPEVIPTAAAPGRPEATPTPTIPIAAAQIRAEATPARPDATPATATPTAAAAIRPEATPAPAPAARESNVTVLPRRPPPAPVPKQKRPRLVALAASVVTAMVAALTLWLSRPLPTLAAEVVKHVEGEPNSWYKTEPVESAQISAVLRKSGVKLGPGMLSIVYASSCWFRGHFVPHFVVTTEDGPVTVMILAHEKVSAPEHFNEDGFTGMLVPAPNGSVAVLSRTPMSLEKPASSVVKALQSPGGPGGQQPL
ncbi:MAG: DUF3379 family protein, partial [Sinobacteraceae bacterium]|nr:DUF3379 family protein [Nevskiaceae bacterium]